MIQAPITKKKYKSFLNNKEVDSIFNSKGKYFNFNELLKLNDSLFVDDNHLNQYGVDLFNEKLFNSINFKKI